MLSAAPAFDKPRTAAAEARPRPRRVCMFVTNCVSIDTRVIKEAASLVSAGHEVTVLGLAEEGQPARETIEGFTVRRLRPDTLRRARRGPLAALRAPLEMAWALGDYWRRALKAATAEPFDVYHAHDLVTLPVAWAARARRGGRLVYDAHELFTEMARLDPLSRVVFRALETLLIGRADRVFTVNESIARELARRYGVSTPLVLRNCPRTASLAGAPPSRLRERAGVPAGVPIVLYQGLYMPHRGLENLVTASASFARAHLVFMGWGPLLPDLEARAAALGPRARVRFIDAVPMGELLAMTAGADLGVIPYRNVGLNNFYTSPNKLFEYVAAGVPVAASAFPELVKVVEGLELGRTFDPDDPASIAAAVNAILEDPAEHARRRANAARAAPAFSWEVEVRTLLEAYASLAAPATA